MPGKLDLGVIPRQQKLGALIGKLDAADALTVLPSAIGAAQIHCVDPASLRQ